MKIQPVKGTRDFYPPDMARRNWIIDGWKRVSVRNGFEEYDGPIFEYLKMFQIKSGDEIVEQLFSLTDRGGRELALRPEITPTLARMVNQQINSLSKPIKWFSVPRLFRAERPQKGRLREFFQWNIDIIGEPDVLADAETIFCALDYLQEVGLTPADIVVKISSRTLLAAVLKKIGVPKERLELLYPLLDKKDKLPLETFSQMLNEQVAKPEISSKILAFMEVKKVSEIRKIVQYEDANEIDQAIDEQAMLIHHLNQMGVGKYCQFDPSVIRGLAYYTGIVYEIYDRRTELRAIGGGGRYDNLLRDFGGPEIPATGFGIGDSVLGILLEQKGLVDKNLLERRLDYFVATVGEPLDIEREDGTVEKTAEDVAIELTAELRRAGCSAAFSYKSGGLSKQIGEASSRNATKCIIIGEEFKNNQLVIKDMTTGKQELVDYDKLLSGLKS
jgi:histidyl-tRNA synthetase